MRMQRAPVLTLTAVVALAAAALALADPSSGEDGRLRAQTIAEAETSDFRTILTATRESGGGAPTAAVTAATFRKANGLWAPTGSRRLTGTYFWHTVTGPRAVCRLELRTAGPGTSFRPHAVVQLLASPSLGCGRVARYDLAG